MNNIQTPIAFSGDIPKFYDAYLGPMFFEPYAQDMAHRIGKISPSNILELACGTGRLSKLLPKVTSGQVEIIASDINPAMTLYAKNQVQDEHIKWMEIDALSLPFDDESFDCVIVQFGVMFYSDRIKAFKEAQRVLKPGGTFIFNCWDEIKNNPMPSIANEALRHFFPIDTPAFYSVPFSYYDEKTIRMNLEETGFHHIQIELVKLTGQSASAADASKGLIHGTPTVTAIESLDAEKLPLIVDWIEHKVTDQFGTSTFQVPLQALVVSGTKP